MRRHLIKCGRCNGKGEVPLGRTLCETFALVPWRMVASTEKIAAAHKEIYVGTTAISNRLARLRALDLVTCEVRGKRKFWRRK